MDDLLAEIRPIIDRGERVLVSTLTKRSAEDLAEYMADLGIKVRYIHSELDTFERAERCATFASASSPCSSASTFCARA